MVAVGATLAAVGAANVQASAAPSITASDAAAARITPTGVGAVKLGATHTSLHAQHLVGKLT